MKVKKYIADSMPEAMKEIRNELGSEALILQSKEIRPKGFFGRFRSKKIEVIAVKDPEAAAEEKKPAPAVPKQTALQTSAKSHSIPDEKILQEIQGLKKLLEKSTAVNDTNLPADYQLALYHLLEQEVEESLAHQLIKETKEQLDEKTSEPEQTEIYSELKSRIMSRLEGLSFAGISGQKKIVQFTGPTGVGKTTTIAKIAAGLILQEKKKVAFITTDTYRIAAVEQLKTYARILDVPLEVAYNVIDYHEAIKKFSSYDVVLVDTAGRNFRNPIYMEELKKMMAGIPEIANYLVLSLTSKPKDLQAIFEQFEEIPLTQLIFTKMDETTAYGSMLSLAVSKNIGIAYLTNGQDVPDDLIKPDADLVSRLIAGKADA